MTTAAIYTRISVDHTGEALGVQRQYDACLELANRLNWTVVDHFDDNDISAYSGKTRPGFEAMLDAMKHQQVGAVLCWHPDRLYRSMKDLERLIDVADASGIALHTVNGGDFDLSNSSGRMIARILGSVSRQESEHKGERQVLAYAQLRAAGKWQEAAYRLFGYDSKGQVVEHEAVLVRGAVTDLLAGRSVRSVAREWNENGVVTVRGFPWRASVVRRLLTNPRLAALVPYQGKVVGKGEWEPIIDEETHLALTALLNDPKRRTQQGSERRHVGSGVYRCGVCGAALRPTGCQTRKNGQRYYYYGCAAREETVGLRGSSSHLTCMVKPLDAYVEHVILELLSTTDVGSYVNDNAAEVADLARRRDGVQLRLDELTRMFTSGAIEASQLAGGTAELRQQLAGLNARIATVVQTSAVASFLDRDGENSANWAAASAEMRGRIIDELVTVTVMPVGHGKGRRPVFDPNRVVIEQKN